MKNDTVTIRPLKKIDLDRMTELANNINIAKNLRDGFPYPYTRSDADEFCNKISSDDSVFVFAIEYNGLYVGNIGLHKQHDVYRLSAEIGYFIGEEYWNKGIATKAVSLVTDFGFSGLEINRIYTGVYDYNIASQRVLEKCSYAKEGVFKNSVIKNGKVCDEIRYAILKPE